MAIDANISIDGKPRGRYDFPEKVPKKLSDLENDLFYVRKKYIFHVTKDTIENYPVAHQLQAPSGVTMNFRKYSGNTQFSYKLYYRANNSEELVVESGLIQTLPNGMIALLGGVILVIPIGVDTTGDFGVCLDPGTYFLEEVFATYDHVSLYYYETKTIDDSFINPKEAYVFDVANIDDRSEQSKAYIEWQKGRHLRLKNSDSYQDLIGAKDFGEYVSFYFLSVGEGAVQSVDSYNFYKEATQSN